MRTKYPRTLHHPSSPGVQSDDKIALDLSHFVGAEVVVTEKMDGENTTLYSDGFHARSLDSGRHPARDWLARFQAERGYMIPSGWRVCGENLFAQHAVAYSDLPAYFLGFSVWDSTGACLRWDETSDRLSDWDIAPVRTLWRGTYSEAQLAEVSKQIDLDRVEGWVMRLACGFALPDFRQSVVKWVRPGHVQQDAQHWSHAPIVQNGLIKG